MYTGYKLHWTRSAWIHKKFGYMIAIITHTLSDRLLQLPTVHYNLDDCTLISCSVTKYCLVTLTLNQWTWYIFSGRPSVIHVVVLCFRDISSWRIFAKLLSLAHSRDRDELIRFWSQQVKLQGSSWPNASQIFMFPLYLQYLSIDFRQTFVTGASWDADDLITFLGQKVKVQGHTIAAEAHSSRRYLRVQLFLV